MDNWITIIVRLKFGASTLFSLLNGLVEFEKNQKLSSYPVFPQQCMKVENWMTG